MIVTENTKISSIIEENELAIEAIASVNPHFQKLKNPILRKLLASRVTVKQAAGIGKTTPDSILAKLKEVGFVVEMPTGVPVGEVETEQEPEAWDGELVEMDVRAVLSAGGDPLKNILKKLKELGKDKVLVIINTFEPVPLINLLSRQGYKYKTEQKDGLFYTSFKFEKLPDSVGEDTCGENGNFMELVVTYQDNMVEVDVKKLEMPGPMMAILAELEKLLPDKALLVHHKKVPHLLLPELEEKGFKYAYEVADENNVKLIIYR
ncbi:DUF2249 domain-containing protein [Cytophagaceae bacterium ABcell3]|nr:DUF2249 domain-containing protein [Cytophagaceae bacterium ABcell3]